MLSLGPAWDLAVDIGANYGEMLAGSKVTPASRVVAIEPNPIIMPLLARTCAELSFAVELVEKVLSDGEAGGLSFAIDNSWSGTSHIVTGGESVDLDRFQVINVASTTLDALFPAGAGAAVIKIDVEGAEAQVLRGAEHFFASSQRIAVMMEIFHMPVQDLWDLQKSRPFYLWNRAAEKLVALDVRNANELGTLLHSGEYYRQDAVMLAGTGVESFDAELRARFGSTRDAAEKKAADARREADDRARTLADMKAELDERGRAITRLREQLTETEHALVRANAELTEHSHRSAALERDLSESNVRLEMYRRSRAHRLAAWYVKSGRAVRRRLQR
ncbi:FkbM family methyltransferase [Agromyces sp. Leaf222]|uniref:FkbM family methyltransferase n=1 Tax=Agromyces sp. Leaf222 TaxID=1735688 RepID=UPI00138ED685|nr:FkbM family methyltransferase [Agromyces sp. Leaf222]